MGLFSARRFLSHLRMWAGEICILAVATFTAASGILSPLSEAAGDLLFSQFSRPVSGDIVLVQIDARSLNQLDSWPWPRSRHAKVIDWLREAGADTIALDIDFSSKSTEAEDQALAGAIGRAEGRVILPGFIQPASSGRLELIEASPLPVLAEKAIIGNANIFARDGIVRQSNLGLFTPAGEFRPSFAALLSQRGVGGIDRFLIDYSFRPSTIPHISYVDILNGTANETLVRGKRVIIGATAIELGDRVSVPVYGVIAGAELQAMIAETILQQRMLLDTGIPGQQLLVLAVLLWLRPGRRAWTLSAISLPYVAAGAGVALATSAMFMLAGLMLDPVPATQAIILALGYGGMRELALRAQTVIRERTTSSMRRTMIELIVEESSDGIIVAGQSGRIELCNEQAAHLLNTTRKSLTGRAVQSYLPRFESVKAASGTEPGGIRACDLSLEGAEGEITVELSIRRTHLADSYNGDKSRTDSIDVYTLTDVTAVRKAQAAEARAHEERLLAERAKNNFIANMSHELRTPLNAIIGFSELLAGEILGPVQQRSYVEHADLVVRSGHHLLAVINNVLDVARLDSEVVEASNTELEFAEVAESSIGLVTKLRAFREQQIDLHIAPDARFVLSDARLLRQVTYNLLSNAVKFSNAGGHVRITAWVEGDTYLFEVADNGTGIDEKVLPTITELFGHAESGFIRPHDGMGVGLYLVKRCLEKLGGRLTFDSERGKGTRARVILPHGAMRHGQTEAA